MAGFGWPPRQLATLARGRLIATGLRVLQMYRDFFDPSPEQQNIVLIDVAILRQAEQLVASCEYCNPNGAEIPFDWILDRVSGSDPSVTDYILECPAKCSNCRREILEKTLGEPE